MKRTVLITGCSSGLGKASAMLFAERGWNVIATMRDPAAADGLSRLDGVLVSRLDVRDPASIERSVAAGLERFDHLEAVVNNAGFGLFGIFEATSREKIQEQFDVNVFGAMEVTRAVLPHFRARRSGVVVNISAGAGIYAPPMMSLYCASKFALEGFSESLSYELAPLGIRMKIVETGGVASTNFAQRSAEEAARMDVPPDYRDFVTGSLAIFDSLRAIRLAVERDVADIIYRAATDETDRLRYVATDDIKPLAKARRETSEDDYMRFMRAQFTIPKATRRAPERFASGRRRA